MRTECDEVADNIPLPSKRLTFDEALAIVREAMPDETVTVIDNVALLADAALEGLLQVAATPSQARPLTPARSSVWGRGVRRGHVAPPDLNGA